MLYCFEAVVAKDLAAAVMFENKAFFIAFATKIAGVFMTIVQLVSNTKPLSLPFVCNHGNHFSSSSIHTLPHADMQT